MFIECTCDLFWFKKNDVKGLPWHHFFRIWIHVIKMFMVCGFDRFTTKICNFLDICICHTCMLSEHKLSTVSHVIVIHLWLHPSPSEVYGHIKEYLICLHHYFCFWLKGLFWDTGWVRICIINLYSSIATLIPFTALCCCTFVCSQFWVTAFGFSHAVCT